MIDPYKLLIIIKVAELKSFSRAAEQLNTTQSNVSFHISSIENALGIKLFERSRGGVTLTKEGKRFYDEAKNILISYERLEKEFIKPKNRNLRVGFSNTVGSFFAASFIGKFYEKYKIKVEAIIANTNEIKSLIEDKILNLGIVEDKVQDLVSEKLLQDRLVLIGSLKTPFEYLSLKDLEKLPIIMREKDSGTRQLLDRTFKKLNITINPAITTNSIRLILNLVKNFNFYAFLSEKALEEERDIKVIKVENLDLKRFLYALYEDEKFLHFEEKAFLDICKNYDINS